MAKVDELIIELQLETKGLKQEVASATRAITNATDRMTRDAKKASKGFAGMGISFKKLIGIVGGIAAIRGIKRLGDSFLDAGIQSENFGVRLKILLGSVEEGNKVFQDASKFASQVAFEFREVLGASVQLATVLDGGADQISKFLPLIADIAAATGLTLEQTAEQFTRSFAAGIGAADLFREKGVTAVLGFEAGAKVSIEETRAAFENALGDMDFKFRGAADALGETMTGITSQLTDKWFQFRNAVLDAGVFELLKESLSEFNDELDEVDFVRLGRDITDSFIEAAESIETVIAVIKDLGSILSDEGFIADRISDIEQAFIAFGEVFDMLVDGNKRTKDLIEANAGLNSEITKVANKYNILRARLKAQRNEQDKAKKSTEEAKDEQKKSGEIVEVLSKSTESLIEKLREKVRALEISTAATIDEKVAMLAAADATDKQKKELKELLTRLDQLKKKTKDAAKETDFFADRVKKAADEIQDALADTFIDVFNEGLDSAKDFSEKLKQIMFKTFAEIAAQKIIGGIGASFFGGAGGGGAAGGGGGGFGSIGTSLIGKGIGAALPAGIGGSIATSLGLAGTAAVGPPTAAAAAAGLGIATAGIGLVVALALPAILGALSSEKRAFSGAVGGILEGGGISGIQSKASSVTTTNAVDKVFGGLADFLTEVTKQTGTSLGGGGISTELGRGANEFRLQSTTGFAQTASQISQRFGFDPEDAASITEAMADTFVALVKLGEGNEEFLAELAELEMQTGSTTEAISKLIAKEEEAFKTEFEEAVGNLEGINTGMSDTIGQLRMAMAEARQLAKAFEQVIDALDDTMNDLLFGDLSILNPVEQLRQAREQFQATSGAALGGDLGALQALPDVINRFLEESRAVNASSVAFAQDFALAQSAIEGARGVAQGQANFQTARAGRAEAALIEEGAATAQTFTDRTGIDRMIGELKALRTAQEQQNVIVEDLVAQQAGA